MANRKASEVFDYRGLRLLMGLIALSLPVIVTVWSEKSLSSISASYFTDARDIFVGLLFVVGSFLLAYNGHSQREALASRVAALAAFLVALFPTTCDACQTTFVSSVHYAAAAALFSILAFFCFIPFRLKIKGCAGRKGRRSAIYLVCGWTMIGCMAAIVVAKQVLPVETANEWQVTYISEALALVAFGVAWITSGKVFRLLADDDEMYHPFARDTPITK